MRDLPFISPATPGQRRLNLRGRVFVDLKPGTPSGGEQCAASLGENDQGPRINPVEETFTCSKLWGVLLHNPLKSAS